MSFDFGYFSLEAKKSGTWHYWFGGSEETGGEDRGAQFAMAHTLEGYGATLYVTAQGKSNTGRGGWLYWVTVYNDGPYSTHFKFQGGGFI